MSDPAPSGNAIDLDPLRQTLDGAVRQALDTDELRQAIDAAVRRALDTPVPRQMSTPMRKLRNEAP